MARLMRDEYKRKLENEFKTAEKVEGEIQAVYAQYLCVRVSGYLESCLKDEITSFTAKKCSKNIQSYIISKTRNITNLTNDKIINTLKEFSQEWAEYYKQNIEEPVYQSIGSIYDNRNNIAHGKNCNISLLQVKKHYENIIKIVETIHDAITKP